MSDDTLMIEPVASSHTQTLIAGASALNRIALWYSILSARYLELELETLNPRNTYQQG